MRKYEMMVIFKPNLSDEDLKNEEEKIKNLILESGGEFINSNLWGKRKLAYQIENRVRVFIIFFILKYLKINLQNLKQH